MITLNAIWFLILGILLTGYAILDGFDLGVGVLHPVARSDRERRLALNSIGPLWDGNEVWLVTFGGALFAAFPEAYATIFSGYYLVFVLLLGCLIFRAVSMEFRSKMKSPAWRRFWDSTFWLSCVTATFLFGAAVGNAMIGLPLDDRAVYSGGLLDLLNPYALLVGAMTVSLFALHGAIYLYLKTEGEYQARIHGWIWRAFFVFLILFGSVTIYTFLHVPTAFEKFRDYPVLALVPILNLLAIANVPRALYLERPGYAFFSSCCMIAALVFLFGTALFPHLVRAEETAHSLTIYNAASSPATLEIMLWIALIGMPFVLFYTVTIYWIYRGKVKLDEFSY